MKGWVVAALVGALVPGFLPPSTMAASAGNPDQFNACGPYDTSGAQDLAQTFTAGKSGPLTGVDLWLDGSGTVGVRIETTSADQPSGTELAATSLSFSATDRRIRAHFAFSPAPVVSAGGAYALVFTTSGSSLACGSPDTYAGGRAWTDGDVAVVAVVDSDGGATGHASSDAGWTPLDYPADFAFRTYVDDGTPVVPTAVTTEPAGQPFTFVPTPNATPPTTTANEAWGSSEGGDASWPAGLAVAAGILGGLIVAQRRRWAAIGRQ
jgi:hypothetical protein